jgi:hypothetical protein
VAEIRQFPCPIVILRPCMFLTRYDAAKHTRGGNHSSELQFTLAGNIPFVANPISWQVVHTAVAVTSG